MAETLLRALPYLEPVGVVAALVFLMRAKEHRTFMGLTALLSARLFDNIICGVLLQLWQRKMLHESIAYPLYFYVYWIGFTIESCLAFYIVLNIFRVAMAPLSGLRKLGMLVFRWAAAISVVLALTMTISSTKGTVSTLIRFLFQLQQVSSIIIICLLFFVCFAIRPLGLSTKSRVFGVALGLGLTAAASLAQAAWFGDRTGALFSVSNLLCDLGSVTGLLVWSVYFALPEPKRQIIVLPTTSPFLRWNQISEVLGDNPGYVAIAGIPPELLAPAEVEIMIRASIKMKQIDEFDPHAKPKTFESLSA